LPGLNGGGAAAVVPPNTISNDSIINVFCSVLAAYFKLIASKCIQHVQTADGKIINLLHNFWSQLTSAKLNTGHFNIFV